MDYSSLYSGESSGYASIASTAIKASADITDNIMSVKSFKYEMQSYLDQINANRQEAINAEIQRRWEEEIAYTEYVLYVLDDLQAKLEKIQQKQQRKKLIVYGTCAALTFGIILVSLKK